MNTRAPTNLHLRSATNSNNNNSNNNNDNNEDGPMDERHARTIQTARTVLSSEKQYLSKEDIIQPNRSDRNGVGNGSSNGGEHNEWGSNYKTKKIRNRPWKKQMEYNGIHLDDDDSHSDHNDDEKKEEYGHVVKEEDDDHLSYASDDSNDLDDLSSRWSHQSSKKADIRRATVQAVALASAAAANQQDEDDDDDEDDDLVTVASNASSAAARSHTLRQGRQVLSESSYNHRMTTTTTTSSSTNANNSSNASNRQRRSATPQKPQDHERVRMEALQMLELADPGSSTNGHAGYALQKTRGGGYSTLVSTSSINTTRTTSSNKNKDGTTSRTSKRNPLQKLGLDHESKASRGGYSRGSRSNGQFVIQNDDDDLVNECQTEDRHHHHHLHVSPVKFSSMIEMEELPNHHTTNKSTTSSWSSRYSVDRHLLPLHGGKSSRQVLDQMDKEHYNKLHATQRQSATTLYKTSPHENMEDRWNVNSGGRSSMHQNESDEYYPRLWYTWLLATKEFMHQSGHAVKETTIVAKDKVEQWIGSVRDKRNNHDYDGPESHMTLGSHRHINHSSSSSSSSPRGIFTGVVAVMAKCSPTKRSGNWRNVNLRSPSRDLPNMDFTAQDDYEHDKAMKQRRFKLIALALFLLLGSSLLAIFAGKSRSRSGGFIDGSSSAGETFQFYVISDTPRNPADATKLSRELQNLHHSDGDFLIHLGDVHAAATSMCTYSSYEDAAELLKESPIPTLVLPGDNDWNNCPRPESAFAYWSENLNRFEENYKNEDHEDMPIVTRQLGRDENFAFLHKGVLFIGLNLVDGKVQSEREWTIRHQENVQWVEEQINLYKRNEFRAVVLMGHAGYTSKVGDFFWPVIDDFKTLNKPVLYVHANNGDGSKKYYPDDLEDFTALRLEKGSLSPPLQITITTDPQPFKFNS
jgi:hypothetical protein